MDVVLLMLMWGVARPAAFVCNVLCSVPVSLCVLGDVMFLCRSMCFLLSGSHFTHTPHPHHNTSTHHTQSSPLTHYHRLVLAHASLRWHTVLYSVPVDARCALIKSTQIKPSYNKPYPHKYNYKDTRKDAHKDAHKYVACRHTLSYTLYI